jgi:SAM-dependent methyltransferase
MAENSLGSLVATRRPSLLSRLRARLRRSRETRSEPPRVLIVPPGAGPPLGTATGLRAAPDPLTIRQWLWGTGFTIPGTHDDALALLKPLGLTPGMSLLDVAAGLGGTARAVAKQFGGHVTGLERDPETARQGMAMSVARGLAKRAPVSPFDPESFELRAGGHDCVLGREATYAVQDKERFLRVLILGLKPRGQLLLTEFVLEPEAGGSETLEGWAAQQPYQPSLWTAAQYADCLASLGFEIRAAEDITAPYRSQILSGWSALLASIDLRHLPRRDLVAVVDEAERWTRTAAALERGGLRMMRFHAVAGRKAANG